MCLQILFTRETYALPQKGEDLSITAPMLKKALEHYIGPGGNAWVRLYCPNDEQLQEFIADNLRKRAKCTGKTAATVEFAIHQQLRDEPIRWFTGMVIAPPPPFYIVYCVFNREHDIVQLTRYSVEYPTPATLSL
jgi:hypothetical protein